VFHRSTDGGLTWSDGIRVNQDSAGNGKYQVFPAIRVDEASNINVVYYDSRNTPTNDSVEVFIARSGDGGNTWTDVLVSDHKSRPKAGYQGDYIGITSSNGKIWPVWMDDFTGVQQAWTVGVDVLTGVVENNSNPKIFSLEQNYPNPFNPVTKIRFTVPAGISSGAFVSILIYDMSGKHVETLLNKQMNPGSHEVEWNAANYSSGVYFYKLQAEGFVDTKKMILIK
jgi:hypothetical protein